MSDSIYLSLIEENQKLRDEIEELKACNWEKTALKWKANCERMGEINNTLKKENQKLLEEVGSKRTEVGFYKRRYNESLDEISELQDKIGFLKKDIDILEDDNRGLRSAIGVERQKHGGEIANLEDENCQLRDDLFDTMRKLKNLEKQDYSVETVLKEIKEQLDRIYNNTKTSSAFDALGGLKC